MNIVWYINILTKLYIWFPANFTTKKHSPVYELLLKRVRIIAAFTGIHLYHKEIKGIPMRTFKTILVTGGAGFIGSNLIHYLFSDRSGFAGRVVNLDALTYAGNPESLAEIQKNYGGSSYFFVQADICGHAAVEKVFAD